MTDETRQSPTNAVSHTTCATEAARNVALKERFPKIDDPVMAIEFAVSVPIDECQAFLDAWLSGAWAEIEDCWPHYLGEQLTNSHRPEGS